MADNNGEVDITAAVNAIQSAFVTYGSKAIIAAELAYPPTSFLASWPVLDIINQKAIEGILNLLSKDAVMLAFFANTAVKKASQAQDFINAVNAKNNLPPNVSEEEYAKAEQAQMDAFKSFVVLTD